VKKQKKNCRLIQGTESQRMTTGSFYAQYNIVLIKVKSSNFWMLLLHENIQLHKRSTWEGKTSKIERLQQDLTRMIAEALEDQYNYVTSHPGEYVLGTLEGMCEMADSIKNQLIMSGYNSCDLASIVDDYVQK
jgi:late competence protein required for DNA uptake (superfamily II DNA/RNA helicase)